MTKFLKPIRTLLPRCGYLICHLMLIFIFTRSMIRALPGDPLETLIEESGTTLPIETLRAELGLDRPFFQSVLQDAEQIFHGNWGTSLLSKQPVAETLFERLSASIELTLLTLLLGITASLIIGLIACAKTSFGKKMSQFCTYFGAASAALPSVWIGPVMIYLFTVMVPLFSLSDSLILPAITIALSFTGFWSRLIRERVSETLKHGAARAARARGISEARVICKYGLAPAGGSLIAYLGNSLGGLLAGTFVIELIFNRPGLGMLLVNSVLARDYPVIEASVFLSAAFILSGVALGDWLKELIDPRKELI